MWQGSTFYDHDKRLRTAFAILDKVPIQQSNREDIQRYLSARKADGIGPWQTLKMLYHLMDLGKILVTAFRDANRSDIERTIGVIESRDYSPWTKSDYRGVCKRFFRWLRGTEEYPPEVRWLKVHVTGASRKLPEELLTATDVQRMVQAADLGRDRALIVALYESGCRIGEIGQLKIRHLEFDDRGARLIVVGKTGMRRVRVVTAAEYLKKWLGVHPFGQEPDAPLWVHLRGKGRHRIMTRDAMSRVLERSAKRARIKKRIHPHLFRDSRATHLASQLTEAQLKEMFGWAAASGQAATYVHLSGRNVDEAILRTYTDRDKASPMVRGSKAGLPWPVLAALLQDAKSQRFLTARARRLGLMV